MTNPVSFGESTGGWEVATDNRLMKVLLVDGNEHDRVTIRELLSEIEGRRYDLEWVRAYDAALETIQRDHHDVCLIDYHLGERNGLEFLRDAILLGCQTPFILLTGEGDRQVSAEAMKAGATDYLVKNQIEATLLERAIRYSVDRSRLERERAKLEQQLRHSQKMEAVGQLAGGIAHDFNNLLTAILCYAEIGVAMTVAGSQLMTQFQEIRKAAQRATDLTSQLLAFSRRRTARPRLFDLNDLILSTHTMLRRLIGEDIEVVTIAAPELGPVKVDPGQVEQVLINLAINARDAMPNGGKLTFEAENAVLDEDYASRHADAAPGEYVMLAVSDNGTGMTKEVGSRIFEPFFTTKEEGKGTGLGLSTCYSVVRQHGGHISVHSEPGQGTTFRIYLPRADGVSTSQPHRSYSEGIPRGKESVLLVDDEETVRSMAAIVLREQGYTVFEAENGSHALRIVEESDGDGFDLLLTDVVMPLMGGRELAKHIKAKNTHTKILYTSGYTDAILTRRGGLDPEAEFIPKPFTPDSLARRVRRVLDVP